MLHESFNQIEFFFYNLILVCFFFIECTFVSYIILAGFKSKGLTISQLDISYMLYERISRIVCFLITDLSLE